MFKDWLSEMRVKSLLLASTNCGVGCGLGYYYGKVTIYSLIVGFLVVVTGVLLQILSNFADDYGDALKKADGPNRLGPIRAVMIGSISLTSLRKSLVTVTLMSCTTGIVALLMAIGSDFHLLSWFIFIGVRAILGAICYTIGVAYGYKGLGDIAVFIFFGLAAVIGSQILVLGSCGVGVDVFPDTSLLACAIGLPSIMVLLVPSLRDITEDRLSGKKTIPARLGPKKSAVYLLILFAVSAFLSMLACIQSHKLWESVIVAVALMPLAASTYRTVIHCEEEAKIAKERKFCLIGCAIHNIAWMLILSIDFWVYY